MHPKLGGSRWCARGWKCQHLGALARRPSGRPLFPCSPMSSASQQPRVDAWLALTRTWCAASALATRLPRQCHNACAGTWQDQTFCSTTGFKREVKCVSSALVNDSTSDPGASEVRQRESYLAFQGCSPETNTFGTVVRFEARPHRDWRTWLHPERSHHDR